MTAHELEEALRQADRNMVQSNRPLYSIYGLLRAIVQHEADKEALKSAARSLEQELARNNHDQSRGLPVYKATED